MVMPIPSTNTMGEWRGLLQGSKELTSNVTTVNAAKSYQEHCIVSKAGIERAVIHVHGVQQKYGLLLEIVRKELCIAP